MELGALELKLVSDGGFRLDGGAMFGVVPRALWEKVAPPDEQNRIRMATNCLLVERGSDLLLIDTGIGDKHDAKFMDMYATDPEAVRLPESIRRAGYELGDVTHVLLSHLHFDHCGWNTHAPDGPGGRIVPTFPKARYWLQRGEVDHARLPNERDRASYFPDNWEPLFEAGVVELFGDEAEPVPGVKAVRVPGHNANMCIVLLDGAEDGDGEAKAVYWADLVPRATHVPYPWIMSYDLYPLTTLENKKLWLPQAAAGNWLSIFEHDPDVPCGRIIEEKPGRYRAVPVEVPEVQPART
ncbi:MAG TPA: MBL fold metallo-hydrolase [Thermoanaerobaculia bacterium]|jgi:glyoxylase-like metal-dependent hydrolase (beta-lactamase superfamily II)|nr:MBL fold metallo-hydrolase [Thermoanaerobaculia bacterium]